MKLNSISDLFWKLSPNIFFFSLVLGIVTGLSYAMLIPILIKIITSGNINFYRLHEQGTSFINSPTYEIGALFVGTCIAIIALKTVSSILSMYIASKASMQHRLSIYEKVQSLSFSELEKFGQSKIINLIKIDVQKITQGAISYPLLWSSMVTVIGLMGYLAVLNVKVFVIVVIFTAVGTVLYRIPLMVGMRFFIKARDDDDLVQEGLKGLILGAKELKLSKDKRKTYYVDYLFRPEDSVRSARLKGAAFFIFGENFGEMFSYLLIALVVFHLPYVVQLDHGQVLGSILALIYITGPLRIILDCQTKIREGEVSLRKLHEFEHKLQPEVVQSDVKVAAGWQTFRVSHLSYRYDNHDESFALLDIDLAFERGEITFIIGGNGSGKSTLSKCLTTHYLAESGALMFDKHEVTSACIDNAREQFSAIYSDFYLFPQIFNQYEGIDKDIEYYLDILELKAKVTIKDGRFSTTQLSDGQKKRLALLQILIDDRPLCLFDEWASDQDPRFKDTFYNTILPDLKKRHKAVIVISHDDRYFDVADKVVTMENGKVKSIIQKCPEAVLSRSKLEMQGPPQYQPT